VNVSKGILSGIVASMVVKVDMVGDFTNKSCRSTSILCMIANRVLKDVIIFVIGIRIQKALRGMTELQLFDTYLLSKFQ
jgi:hypothetical protein